MKKYVILLCVIILIGLILRTYAISRIPTGIDWDEASYGYNAYSIVKTGADEWGKKLPLTFQAFGDSKQPLYVYLTAPFIALLGLTAVSIKIVPILAGTLSILFIYLIAYKVYSNRLLAFLSALFLAFSPFGIFYSRLALEISLFSALTLAGIYFELLYLENKKGVYWLFSTVFLGGLFFCYNPARITSAALIFSFLAYHLFILRNPKKIIIPVAIIFVVLLIVGLLQSKQSWLSRLRFVGIFGDKKSVVLQIQEYRQGDKNSLSSKLLHNKLTFFSLTLLENYAAHFGTSFLAYSSFPDTVQVPTHGPLYPIQAPLYYYGLILVIASLLQKKQKLTKYNLAILIWITVAPLSSFITEGGINKRYMGALGTWELLSAYGFISLMALIKAKRNKIILALSFGVIYLFSVAGYLRSYFVSIPGKYQNVYFLQQNLMAKNITGIYGKYDQIIVSKKTTGEPQVFVLFFSRFDPKKYILTKKYVWNDNWYEIMSFDKTSYPEEISPAYLQKIDFSIRTIFYITGAELTNLGGYLQEHNFHVQPLDPANQDKFRLYVVSNTL